MAEKGLLARDRLGSTAARRIVAGSMKVYVSEGDGETGNPVIDVVPGNISHTDLGGLDADPNPHETDLDDLDNVNAASPGDGQVLTWDTATGKWINEDASVGETHPVVDTTELVKGATTATKKMRVDVETNVTAGNTRVLKMADQNVDLAKLLDRGDPFTLEDPQDGKEYSLGHVANASELRRIGFITDASSLTFNMYIKNESTPFATGTAVFSSNQTANTTHATKSGGDFTSKDLTQYQDLYVKIGTVASSTCTKLLLSRILRLKP